MSQNERFCPACGNPLPDGKKPKYCPECGMDLSDRLEEVKETEATSAPVEEASTEQVVPSRTVAKKSAKPKKKKSKAGRVVATVILLLIVISSGGFAFLVLVTWDNLAGQGSYVHPGPGSTESAWIFEVETAEMVNLTFTSNLSAPEVSIDIDYDVSGAFLKGQTIADYYNETFDNASAVKKFSLERKNNWNFMVFDRTVVTITLREDVNYSLTVWIVTGSINLEIPDNQTLDKLNVSSVTGSLSLTIGNNVSISGSTDFNTVTGSVNADIGNVNFAEGIDIRVVTGSVNADLIDSIIGGNSNVVTTTGSLDISLANVTYTQDVSLNFETVTGSVDLDIVQLVDIGANITSVVDVVTGSIGVNYQGNSTLNGTGVYFVGDTTTGSVNYDNQGGFTQAGPMFFSTGYSSGNYYDFDLDTVTGSVDVEGLMV
ncbi:MAG: hypothetical protein ACFFCS_05085 [Candidatus Hodarchaeota archaeon]